MSSLEEWRGVVGWWCGMRIIDGRRNDWREGTGGETAQVDQTPLSMRRLLGETCLQRWKHIAATASISGVAGLNITRKIGKLPPSQDIVLFVSQWSSLVKSSVAMFQCCASPVSFRGQ